MNEQEIAKHRKKKNNSSRSEKKADHKHEYKDCIVTYKHYWSDKYFAHTSQYCIVCGKLNGHRSFIGSDWLSGFKEEVVSKRPDLPVFYLEKFTDDYVNLQEA